MTYTTITLEAAKELLNEYPASVARGTSLQMGDYSHCISNYYSAKVTLGPYAGLYTYRHEMGHATAQILRIETELGKLVMAQPGAKVETNENPFCYGAQRLARGEYQRAIEEYAADAIALYFYDRSQLPQAVATYLVTHLG